MLSLLEAQYGHVIPGLTQAWGCAEKFERYLGNLFFDSRWDRKGWPADAWTELQFLHTLHRMVHRMAYWVPYPKCYETEDEIKWL